MVEGFVEAFLKWQVKVYVFKYNIIVQGKQVWEIILKKSNNIVSMLTFKSDPQKPCQQAELNNGCIWGL